MDSITLANFVLFAGSIMILLGIFSSLIAKRFGAPLVLVFLVLGMLLGEDGLGGLVFSDYYLTYVVGSLALAIILFDGGLRTRLSAFRGIIAPALLLATFGVIVTAVLTGIVAVLVLPQLNLLEALLLGSIVASTDAAAVFFLLRSGGLQLPARARSMLEVESGTNDPVAVFLTIILAELIVAGGGGWKALLSGESCEALEDVLPEYLRPRRWFGGKARKIRGARVRDALDASSKELDAYIALVEVDYVDGDPETYVVPLTWADGRTAELLVKEQPHAIVARVGEGVLYDATVEPAFARELLRVMATRRKLRGRHGELEGALVRDLKVMRTEQPNKLKPSLVRVEQSNTSVVFGTVGFFKLFRKLDRGVNPDLEIARQLTRQGFANTPEVIGELHYGTDGTSSTLGVLKRMVANEGDAWSFTLDALGGYFERVLSTKPKTDVLPMDMDALLDRAGEEPPELARELMGGYMEAARLIGTRTAEMHRALAAGIDRKEFAPEPFSELYQRSLYQSMRNLTGRILQTLSRELRTLPEEIREGAGAVLERKGEILSRMRDVVGEKMEARRIRTHGDYHLGQVLYTGRDFVIIDFEGEPARPLTERRLKRSPLSDVAGMLRSFHYAAYTALADEELRGMARAAELSGLDRWARFWTAWASAAFLGAYLEGAREAEASGGFLPRREPQLRTLLQAHLLEKAVYELGYELNNRPDWVRIPILGIRQLLDGRA